MKLFNLFKRKESNAEEKRPAAENPYLDMRKMALSITPDQLGIVSEEGSNFIYGLVVDLGMGKGSATFTTFLTGDTSMYTSTGGGVIGAGQHENVAKVGQEVIQFAGNYLGKGNRVLEVDLPNSGEVNFVFLTKNGLELINRRIEDVENNNSEYTPLFFHVNRLITEVRQVSGG